MLSVELNKIKLPINLGKVTAQLPDLVSFFLIILVAYTLAAITWRLLPALEQSPVPHIATKNQVSSNNAHRSPTTAGNLANLHLFGIVSKQAPRVAVVPTEAPDTQLRLTLRGVIAGSDIRNLAIISDRAGNEETYNIEASLPGGAVLKEIHEDRVILLHNNRFETLRLPQDQIPDGSAKNAVTAQKLRSNRRNTANRKSNRSQAKVTNLGAEVGNALTNYREILINDPQSLMNAVRAEPYRNAGKLSGYRIFPGKDKKLMDQIGLQPGDIVTAVNGIELNSPLKGLEVMRKVTDAEEVSVNVIRDGVAQTFVVPLN